MLFFSPMDFLRKEMEGFSTHKMKGFLQERSGILSVCSFFVGDSNVDVCTF